MAAAIAPFRGLTKRQEYLRAARGKRAGRPSFALQAVPVAAALPGVGLTVTKKVGNAPERNRIKRRLRAVVRACAADLRPQHDYVLIGRREALTAGFGTLVGDLAGLIRKIHAERPSPSPASSNPAGGPAESKQ